MIVAVDIGNTNLKCSVVVSDGPGEFRIWTIPPKRDQLDDFVLHQLLQWGALSGVGKLMPDAYPTPITWRIAQTGRLAWHKLKTEILKVRPNDRFEIITHKQIPLNFDVDFPEKVGIDRLLAVFAAVKIYGDLPMLIVDAGTAITVDIVYDQTFCGGAILPGLAALTKTYPKISAKLPLVSIPKYPESCNAKLPLYLGKNTTEAIHSGIFWGTVGAIRQIYEMLVSQKKDVWLILTGGDAEYLLQGLMYVIPKGRIHCHDALVLEGIHFC